MANFKEASRKEWFSPSGEINSREEINTGSLQRIADATEKMASNYIQLQNDRDRYKKLYEEKVDLVCRLNRTISGLRGYLNRKKIK